jgi:predicted DNA-binding transcriptional regulator AlpA
MQRLGYQPGRQRAAFWQFAAQNGLPMIRLGRRRVMFCEAAVENWISRRSTGRAA